MTGTSPESQTWSLQASGYCVLGQGAAFLTGLGSPRGLSSQPAPFPRPRAGTPGTEGFFGLKCTLTVLQPHGWVVGGQPGRSTTPAIFFTRHQESKGTGSQSWHLFFLFLAVPVWLQTCSSCPLRRLAKAARKGLAIRLDCSSRGMSALRSWCPRPQPLASPGTGLAWTLSDTISCQLSPDTLDDTERVTRSERKKI